MSYTERDVVVKGGGAKVYRDTVSGPAAYDPATGFVITVPHFRRVTWARVDIANNPGNKLVTWTVSGNQIVVRFYTVSANTTTGAISAAEDAAGTDESALQLVVEAEGY